MLGAMSSLPQYVFMAWCLVKHRDNFTFTFTILLPLRGYSQCGPIGRGEDSDASRRGGGVPDRASTGRNRPSEVSSRAR
jgi:hypothetical protein